MASEFIFRQKFKNKRQHKEYLGIFEKFGNIRETRYFPNHAYSTQFKGRFLVEYHDGNSTIQFWEIENNHKFCTAAVVFHQKKDNDNEDDQTLDAEEWVESERKIIFWGWIRYITEVVSDDDSNRRKCLFAVQFRSPFASSEPDSNNNNNNNNSTVSIADNEIIIQDFVSSLSGSSTSQVWYIYLIYFYINLIICCIIQK